MNIGVDLVKISRFNNKTEGFIKRILHREEYAYFTDINDNLKTKTLATFWAIKEAIFKANNSYYSFAKILLKKENNKWIHPNFSISISHEDDYLIAFVIENKE
ncbi:Holo-[acyl-carrier protein] synthase [Mycoplasmopsis meleagridis]|uniref:Holo-[acyl-carrier protein] synthase n=1 Tax=Mycoplasmopsis meleagridis ATCC 25294 TaxID=1264554 RepID=A0A0F5H024_9BACT|nr:4'-phosphopantetheinyl transferase superfamily protein [Mycoplasmopsis meleagridis]KKB26666.1 Holo-[acyl-carrier protein] synthase [Mycoplasmopsis meleagridis ATCC 25294]KUH47632.1 ACP synthase [Mycoplasmopsis meleagridis]OAD18219.1 Holo-[acyl-carrier protein] synthase [Mycoplasmopsis meleagridis]OAD18422.1 Holo-[acyl-carrier protein] synthase [Mycoplasmopsis meleagridis]VEU77720.1 Holo-[acyl-carrier protein]synthase [Mycoplasmopsis meleagridis]